MKQTTRNQSIDFDVSQKPTVVEDQIPTDKLESFCIDDYEDREKVRISDLTYSQIKQRAINLEQKELAMKTNLDTLRNNMFCHRQSIESQVSVTTQDLLNQYNGPSHF